MDKPHADGRKAPRRIEISTPEHEPPETETDETPEASACPFIPAAENDRPAEDEEPSEDEPETSEEELAKLQQMIEEMEQRCAVAQDERQRIAAELHNYKRRVQQEKDELRRFAVEGLVSELIPILDNFERAMEVDVDSPGAECLMAGVGMIHEQVLAVLRMNGVARIEALGETFDSSLHEAVEREESIALPPNVIVAELAKGYTLNDRLIRPARVRVTVRPKDVEESVEREGEA